MFGGPAAAQPVAPGYGPPPGDICMSTT